MPNELLYEECKHVLRQRKGDAATISAILQSSSDLSSELVASSRSETREGIEARCEQEHRGKRQGWEGEQVGYYGNRMEHLHGRTILGYESAQDD